MARPAKRITRKDLRRPDQFITTTAKLLDLASRYQKTLWIALAAVVILAASFGAWSLYGHRQDRRAAQEYAAALKQYQEGNFQEALSGFEKVAGYGSSAYGRYALLYQANAHLALNEYGNAVPLLQKFLARERGDVFLRQLAYMSLGHAQESRGEVKEAVASYTEASQINGSLRQEALLAKGRAEMLAQDHKAAAATYKGFLATFPNSPLSGEVQLKLAEAEAKAAQK